MQEDKIQVNVQKFQINKTILQEGDVLYIDDGIRSINPKNKIRPQHSFGYVKYMYHQHDKAHIILMYASCKTMVKEYGDPRELFFSYECCDITINQETKVVKVSFNHDQEYNQDKKTYFATKTFNYSTGRYESKPELRNPLSCALCKVPEVYKATTGSQGESTSFYRDNCRYVVGDCVLIKPPKSKSNQQEQIDENKNTKLYKESLGGGLLYPEYHRKFTKTTTNSQNQPSACNAPFIVGRILEIKQNETVNNVKYQRFYRATDTDTDEISDIHKLYLSGQENWVLEEKIVCKCQVSYVPKDEKVDDFDDLQQRMCYSFYFNQFLDKKNGRVSDLNSEEIENELKMSDKREDFTAKLSDKKLKTLELFAGCGGLSEGLLQSGVAELKWAVESDLTSALSYAKNNTGAKVFHRDCNKMLGEMVDNKADINPYYPKAGKVELLCGGPPCQGFSGTNQYQDGDNAINKKDMLTNFLSFVDFLKPHYVLFENVRTFVTVNKGVHIKKAIASFLAMDYQCSFGVLQAGHYGVPQSRQRVIIMACKSGKTLPLYPEPLHVFLNHKLEVSIKHDDDHKYVTNIKLKESAPFIYTTVKDAIEDLPVVEHNHKDKEKKEYSKYEALTSYQKMMRQGLKKVSLHYNTEYEPIVLKRIELLKEPGSDWRDLPNEIHELSDGSYSQYLYYDYLYENPKEPENPYLKKKYKKENLHQAVCHCFINHKFGDTNVKLQNKTKCSTQTNESQTKNKTIIPWDLPHTAYKHGQWKGLYGRILYDGFVGTLDTQARPKAKQGTVLHPNQNRVITCREYARLQGFPDSYEIEGNATQIYKQIGNAVPPPMAKAIGVEIRKAMAKDEKKNE